MASYSKTQKKIDIAILCILPVIISLTALFLKLNFLFTTILFYGLPSIYLLFKTKKALIRALLFSLPFSFLIGILFDYFAIRDKSWYVPTIFPFRLFAIVPFEDVLWGFCFVFLTVLFYEHFFDKGKHKNFDPRMRVLFFILAFLFLLFSAVFILNPSILYIPYFYAFSGIALIPILVILYFSPHMYMRLFKVVPYFLLLGGLNELTALSLGHWHYTGIHFIGWVKILQLQFPLEELLYWMILWAVMVMVYFEFFDDESSHRKVY